MIYPSAGHAHSHPNGLQKRRGGRRVSAGVGVGRASVVSKCCGWRQSSLSTVPYFSDDDATLRRPQEAGNLRDN